MPISLDPQPGDDEIQCARCGAIVPLAVSRCPQCGVNLYEPEDAEADDVSAGASIVHGPGFIEQIKRWLGLSHPADTLFASGPQEQRVYQDLLRQVGGDAATVERLVAYERRRLPRAQRLAWLENARRRWERDNA